MAAPFTDDGCNPTSLVLAAVDALIKRPADAEPRNMVAWLRRHRGLTAAEACEAVRLHALKIARAT